jgi:hypothetical protein
MARSWSAAWALVALLMATLATRLYVQKRALEVAQHRRMVAAGDGRREGRQPTVYVVTPTYARATQKVDLLRLCYVRTCLRHAVGRPLRRFASWCRCLRCRRSSMWLPFVGWWWRTP